jgi:hypothetical protein
LHAPALPSGGTGEGRGKFDDDHFQPAFDRLETISRVNHLGMAPAQSRFSPPTRRTEQFRREPVRAHCRPDADSAADASTPSVGCSLGERQDRAAAAQLNQSYPFPELLEE